MRRLAALLLAVMLSVACGPDEAGPRTLTLALGTGGGNELEAVAGTTSYILVSVLNAEGTVEFEGIGLPAFATLSQNGMLTLAPPATEIGEFDFSLRATAGSQSVTKDVHLVVKRDNQAPVMLMPGVRDPRGFPLDGYVGWDCLQDPYVDVVARDFDHDPIGLEVQAVPVQGSAGSTRSFSVPARPTYGHDGTYVEFTRSNGFGVKLEGLTPGVAYVVSIRVVDALGAASAWTPLPSITCLPFGINLEGNDWTSSFTREIRVRAGQTTAVPLLIEGSSGEPVVLTAERLPAFATLEGTTLTFKPELSGGSSFVIIASSGGRSARAELLLSVTP